MKSGVLLIDKPRGISSAQAIGRAKFLLKPSRIGHAGTLDPLATGLLVCLIGSATRFAHYAEAGGKIYSGIFRFGVTTDSDDSDGAVLDEAAITFTEDALQNAAAQMVGTISQIPPRISAVKVQGVRAYDRVRRNEEVTLTARTVTIEKLSLDRIEDTQYRFLVACSKGTYIRSIARDIGTLLGCGGIVQELRREASFPYSVADANTLDELTPDGILPWETLFPSAPRITLRASESKLLAGGDQRFLNSERGESFAQAFERSVIVDQPIVYQAEDSDSANGILLWNGKNLRLGVHSQP